MIGHVSASALALASERPSLRFLSPQPLVSCSLLAFKLFLIEAADRQADPSAPSRKFLIGKNLTRKLSRKPSKKLTGGWTGRGPRRITRKIPYKKKKTGPLKSHWNLKIEKKAGGKKEREAIYFSI